VQGDTVGVFQVESRAQMSMLPRLRPRCFYDLVIEVAIVRPGPIQGGWSIRTCGVAPGEEPVVYPSPSIEASAGTDAGRAALPGAGDEAGDRRGRIHAGRRPTSCVERWRRGNARGTWIQNSSEMIDGMLRAGIR
jgi:hypothetical protein